MDEMRDGVGEEDACEKIGDVVVPAHGKPFSPWLQSENVDLFPSDRAKALLRQPEDGERGVCEFGVWSPTHFPISAGNKMGMTDSVPEGHRCENVLTANRNMAYSPDSSSAGSSICERCRLARSFIAPTSGNPIEWTFYPWPCLSTAFSAPGKRGVPLESTTNQCDYACIQEGNCNAENNCWGAYSPKRLQNFVVRHFLFAVCLCLLTASAYAGTINCPADPANITAALGSGAPPGEPKIQSVTVTASLTPGSTDVLCTYTVRMTPGFTRADRCQSHQPD